MSPARRRIAPPVRSPPAINSSSNSSRNVTFIADVRTAKIADRWSQDLVVTTADGSVADGAMANTLQGEGHPMRSAMRLPGRRSACRRTTAQRSAPTVTTQPDGHGGDRSVTSQTGRYGTRREPVHTASINNSSR